MGVLCVEELLMMPALNFSVLLIFLGSSATAACAEGTWVYTATKPWRSEIEIAQESAHIVIGDIGYDVTFCDGRALHCFRSEALSLRCSESGGAAELERQGST